MVTFFILHLEEYKAKGKDVEGGWQYIAGNPMPGQDPMLTATLSKSFPCSGLRFPMCKLHRVNDLLAAPTFNSSLTLPKSPHGKRSTSQCRLNGQGLDSRSAHCLLCSALLPQLQFCFPNWITVTASYLRAASYSPSGEPRPLSKGPKPRQTQFKVLALSCPQPGYLETHRQTIGPCLKEGTTLVVQVASFRTNQYAYHVSSVTSQSLFYQK